MALKDNINPALLKTLQVVIIVISALFIMTRLLFSGQAASGPDLLQTMTLDRQEALSEECLSMMEEIRELLTINDLEAIADYTCPLHNKPYEITFEGDTIIVSDPDPLLHGFKTMRVSSKNPELILLD